LEGLASKPTVPQMILSTRKTCGEYLISALGAYHNFEIARRRPMNDQPSKLVISDLGNFYSGAESAAAY
jgi:hypothetical protein